MEIRDWLINFVKNRASFYEEQYFIESTDFGVILKKESGVKKFIIKNSLDDAIFDKIKGDDSELAFVCLNKKVDVDWLINNWDKLITHSNVSFIFANPETNEKWIIFPKVHDTITEKSALKTGLYSLFESICH